MLKKTLVAAALTAASGAALANPPHWAPAYGYRAHVRHYAPPVRYYYPPAPRVVYRPAPVYVAPAPIILPPPGHRHSPALPAVDCQEGPWSSDQGPHRQQRRRG